MSSSEGIVCFGGVVILILIIAYAFIYRLDEFDKRILALEGTGQPVAQVSLAKVFVYRGDTEAIESFDTIHTALESMRNYNPDWAKRAKEVEAVLDCGLDFTVGKYTINRSGVTVREVTP